MAIAIFNVFSKRKIDRDARDLMLAMMALSLSPGSDNIRWTGKRCDRTYLNLFSGE